MIRLPHSLFLVSFLALAVGCGGGADTAPDSGATDASATACQFDDDCPADRFCADDSKTCVLGSEDACTEDMQCGDGRRCEVVEDCGYQRCRNRCVPKACTTSADCGAWTCINGQCAEPISCATAPCPEGQVCNPVTDTCEPTGGQSCADDGECSQGICYRGTCGPSIFCSTSANCPRDLRCIGNVCRDPCTQQEDCPSTMIPAVCDVPSGECFSRCIDDDTCPAEQICESNVCRLAECGADEDCDSNTMEVCVGEENGRGRCQVQALCENRGQCMPNQDCIEGRCVPLPSCRQDRECGASAYCDDRFCQPAQACSASCSSGFDCIGNRCVPAVCRGDASCPSGEVCIGGVCAEPASAAEVSEVRILSPAPVLRPGDSHRFVAVALDATGRIVPGVRIEWSSATPAIASIDALGLATAGASPGTAPIGAAVRTGTMTIGASPVQLTVLEVSITDFRVYVRSGRDGAPIAGASVRCNAETVNTSADGSATFTGTAPMTCTVFAADYDWVTVAGLPGPIAVLRLPPLTRRNSATGYTGTVDTRALPGDQPVRLSISGGALKGGLSTFSPQALFGGDIFRVELPLAGSVEFPAGATASAEFFGQEVDLKPTYHALAAGGLQKSWTFAGRAEISDLGLRGGNLLGSVLPLLQTFRHGTKSELDRLAALPKVVDTNDFDGDGNATESVPDWNNFRPAAMTPVRPQRLRFQVQGSSFTFPANTNVLLLTSGALLPELGFIPLGLDGLADGSGPVGNFSSTMTPPYDGLEAGEYAVIVAAASLGMGGLPGAVTARQVVASTLPASIELNDGLLAFPSGTFVEGDRRLSATSPSGADVWRMRLVGNDGAWHVFAPANLSEIILPPVPSGFQDRAPGASVQLEALDLESGTSLDALFAPGTDALFPDRITRRFSQARVRE